MNKISARIPHLFFSLMACATALLTTHDVEAWGGGAPKPEEPAPPAESPVTPPPPATPPPTPPRTANGFIGNDWVSPKAVNFTFDNPGGLVVRPRCLKDAGYKLVIFDPGHDDSDDSRRSDAKVRGGDGKYTFLWPQVHEGNLAMVTAYLAYELLVSAPELSAAERAELRTMLRLSRHPGEKTFGQYEASGGYGSAGGPITAGIENRVARLNTMMRTQRPFDPQTLKYSTASAVDVASNTLMVSIHGNSSDYFDEGDHSWVIPPKNAVAEVDNLLTAFRTGIATGFGDFFAATGDDDSTTAKLKNGAVSSVRYENVIDREHESNLAVLNTGVATTKKILIEGFVMNGKAGHLAYREIKEKALGRKLEFYRSDAKVASYDYADLYLAYARSVVAGLHERTDCR